MSEKAKELKNELVKNDMVKVSVVEKNLYKKLNKQIANAYASAEKAYFQIACALYEINKKSLFRAEKYKNITDFSSTVYGMKSTQTYAYINIVETFGKINEDGSCTELKEEYKDFTPSKLARMVDIPVKYLSWVKPEWTVKEITEFKNNVKDDVILPAEDEAEEGEQENLPINAPEEDDSILDVSVDEDCIFVAQFNSPEDVIKYTDTMKDLLNDFTADKNFKGKKFHFEINLRWDK
jgi:hypothetical protein